MVAPQPHSVTRVLLVGSQPVSLAGLRALIDNESRMEVVGQVEHSKDSIPPLPVHAPDVTVIEHDEPDTFESVAALAKAVDSTARFIVLTSSTDTTFLANVFRQGGSGLVSKYETPRVLIRAIQRVHEGEMWLGQSSAAKLITDLLQTSQNKSRKKKPRFDHRDRQIIKLLARGLTNDEIAAEIYVSEATVRNQLSSIFKRAAVSGRLQLVVYACQQGLVKLPLAGSRKSAKSTKSTLRLV